MYMYKVWSKSNVTDIVHRRQSHNSNDMCIVLFIIKNHVNVQCFFQLKSQPCRTQHKSTLILTFLFQSKLHCRNFCKSSNLHVWKSLEQAWTSDYYSHYFILTHVSNKKSKVMETVLIQFWNITIRIKKQQYTNIRHVASRGGVHGEGGAIFLW